MAELRKKRNRRIGNISIILGIVLVISAAVLVVRNLREDQAAGEYSQNTMMELAEQMPTVLKRADTSAPETYVEEVNRKRPLAVVNVDGYDYIGVISIPTFDLELPVMSEWSYPNLRLSVCRYYGEYALECLVFCAHNYTSHFGRLRELTFGDQVIFTDMSGNVYEYVVDEVEELGPFAVPEVTAGEWPLTLFTCTVGGRTRVVVRCDFAAES